MIVEKIIRAITLRNTKRVVIPLGSYHPEYDDEYIQVGNMNES